MRASKFLFCSLVATSLLAARPACSQGGEGAYAEWTPVPVEEVLYVRPFTLAEGYLFTWSGSQPTIDSGVVVVVRVDPELVIPRQAPEPILYAGDRVVQRLNSGHQSGHVIAIVPGAFDPSAEPMWFGRPGLPALATPDGIRSQLEAAGEDLRPMAAEKSTAVTREPLQAADMASMLRGEIAELVLEYSPQERELARKWRLPEAKAKPNPARPIPQKAEGGVR